MRRIMAGWKGKIKVENQQTNIKEIYTIFASHVIRTARAPGAGFFKEHFHTFYVFFFPNEFFLTE